MSASRNPRRVDVLLAPRWVMLLLRLLLVSAYLVGGIDKAIHFNDAIAEQAHFGLQPTALFAALAVIVEIAGWLCIVFNRFVWLGAGGLGVLTLVAMLVANNFWALLPGHEQFVAFNSFFEHLGLIAALVIVTRLSTSQPASAKTST